ncbi:C-terminal binding protein [Paenibacillus eucommiae]|uniref:Phosphoglycerate dehydrogenase-like enzyme n=1 Tax=Paenibacillus eucommiae TaxID=1355755 RepID=A0ABS4J2J2_9BACL|nr:C-terminal binding protein [Paenibacillus eucommiae]MBP1994003.1 phosphoglycerate dehydrogenase-like enzyme [Paenibacillus eucommiae]
MSKRGDHQYRVVLTDADRFPLGEAHSRALMQAGIEVIGVSSKLGEEELAACCTEADGVIVFGSKITRHVIERMHKCQILARCGIGFDNICVEAAREKGITITYVPDYCVEEVSDHTVSLMLDCWRKLSLSRDRVNHGFWDSYEQLGSMRRIAGQTVGLLGFGRIAQAVARKLQGFRVKLIAHDPYAANEVLESVGVAAVSFDELIQASDVLALLLPLTPESRHIINRKVLERVKPGLILINTSRGGLIDEDSLVWALRMHKVGAAGMDVLEAEPPQIENPLLHMPNVIITPHSAAFSEEALFEVKARAIEEIIRKFQGLSPLMEIPTPHS